MLQLVIDGHICSSKYLADDGCSCAFEKSDIPDAVPEGALKRRERTSPRGGGRSRRRRGKKMGKMTGKHVLCVVL